MAELKIKQMSETTTDMLRSGEIVDGEVTEVKPDEIILDIGSDEFDGIISRAEYTRELDVDLTTLVSIGDFITAMVLEVNDKGQVLLTPLSRR